MLDKGTRCSQEGCNQPSAYRYTWPGNDEAGVCEAHVGWVKSVAEGLGLHLQVTPLEAKDEGFQGVMQK